MYTRTFLCVKRNSNWDSFSRIYQVPPTISTLFTVNKSNGEEDPPGSITLNRNINHGSMMGHSVYLGFYMEVSTGLCDVPYEAFTVDRYPKTDYPDFGLPMNELPMFVFPHGLRLLRRKHTDAPMPSFYPFVFTGLTGERIHVVCLTFYEELDEGVVRKLEKRHERIHKAFSEELVEMRGGGDGGEKDKHKEKETRSVWGVYAPKCISIISRFPIYRALRRFLRQLYRISLSASPAPLERYISYLVTFLPVPKPGGRAFHIHLENSDFRSLRGGGSKGMGGGFR